MPRRAIPIRRRTEPMILIPTSSGRFMESPVASPARREPRWAGVRFLVISTLIRIIMRAIDALPVDLVQKSKARPIILQSA